MAGPLPHDTTNPTIQDLLHHSFGTSTHLPASAATQAQEMTHSTDMPREDYSAEDTDRSNNSEDDEANAPFKTADGKWRCGWFDKKKQTRCDKVWTRMCDLT